MPDNENVDRIYVTPGSASAYSIRDFLHCCHVLYKSIDLHTDEQASSEVRQPAFGRRRFEPVSVIAR